jgi:AcrR family transcriptional regulator
MAYDLREQGMTLDQVTEACGVSRGSICYLISKGHEQFLTDQRTKD